MMEDYGCPLAIRQLSERREQIARFGKFVTRVG
jgi:hypothetical protein